MECVMQLRLLCEALQLFQDADEVGESAGHLPLTPAPGRSQGTLVRTVLNRASMLHSPQLQAGQALG
jgi:hypothetical protein